MKKVISALLFLSSALLAQFTNVRLNNVASTDPEEVAIAINPVNPLQLGAGANISYFYASSDGGQTWVQRRMTSSLGVWGDPSLIYDGLGYLYFGHLSNPSSGYWIDRIVVQRSTDNGATWNDGAGIGLRSPKEQDKEWLAVDLSTPARKNYLYTTWTEFDNYGSSSSTDSSRILFSRSTDHGITWSVPVRVSEKGGDCVDEDNTVEGAVPTVGPNGEVYTAWSGPLGIMFDRSFDGGITWGTDRFVTAHPGGWDFPIPGISRSNGLPITIADTSRSAYRGYIYICWADQRNGTDNTDIYVIKSTDGGTSWGQPKKVNTDNTARHQFFPWMAVDQLTGVVYFVFYDRRATAGNTTDVYMAKSTDGCETFENFKVSQSSFSPTASVFFGDYTNIAAFNKRIYPLWMRLDNTTLSVWTALVYDSSAVLPVEFTAFNGRVAGNRILLTWSTATETNNKQFVVERFDQGQWSGIAVVPGAGTSVRPKNYTAVDIPPAFGFFKYRIRQVDFNGTASCSDEILVDYTGPDGYALRQNYPNPFNPVTTIGYTLPSTGHVTIVVYDVLGNVVTVLVDRVVPAGLHEVTFSGSNLQSGIYFCRVQSGSFRSQIKMALVK